MEKRNFQSPGYLERLTFLADAISGKIGQKVGNTDFYTPLLNAEDQTLRVKQSSLKGKYAITTANADLVVELQDPQRFDKSVGPTTRALLSDFVFTQWSYEDTWPIHNRIISQTLSGNFLKQYFLNLQHISNILCQKIRFAYPSSQYLLVENEISKTLWDIIGVTLLGEYHGSLYQKDRPELLNTILKTIEMAFKKSQEPIFIQKNRFIRNKTIEKNMDIFHSYFSDKLRDRMNSKSRSNDSDIMSFLINTRDPVTQNNIQFEPLVNQIMGMAAAIFDTSRSSIQFLLYHLSKDRSMLEKAYAEVDSLFPNPDEPITYDSLSRLDFLSRAHQEALRISPALGIFARYALNDTIVLNKYNVQKGDIFQIALYGLHNNPKYWDRPHEFNPDRFLPSEKNKIHPGSYFPFGIGKRSCVGKGFAYLQLMTIVVNLLRSFDIQIDPEYKLSMDAYSLGVQPLNLKISFTPRKRQDNNPQRNISDQSLEDCSEKTLYLNNEKDKDLNNNLAPSVCPFLTKSKIQEGNISKNIVVAFGSNGGFCQSIARKFVHQARMKGFEPILIELNDLEDHLEKNATLIIVTSSYNGFPPANAELFVRALSEKKLHLKGINYAVIGAGDPAWQSSFMSIPILINEEVEKCGGSTLLPMLALNVSTDTVQNDFERWMKHFWKLNGIDDIDDLHDDIAFTIKPVEKVAQFSLIKDMRYTEVTENRELITENINDHVKRSTRHIKFKLPAELQYQPGDYAYFLPLNGRNKTTKALRAFNLDAEQIVTIQSHDPSPSWLPLRRPISYWDLVSACIDLDRTLIRNDLKYLEKHAREPLKTYCNEVLNLSDQDFDKEIKAKKMTLVDFLQSKEYPEIDFSVALEILEPLKKRYYSISSSPTTHRDELTVTVGVQRGSHVNGKGIFEGLCSNFLASLVPGDIVGLGILASHFRLPKSSATPMIWIGAGTGIAPYRAFLQERAELKKQGHTLGECILIAGCQRPHHDQLYADEWIKGEEEGLLKVYWAFSRLEQTGENQTKYVQDVIVKRKNELELLIQKGAHVFICGNAQTIGKAVPLAFGEELFGKLRSEKRAHEDIWGG